MTKKVVTVQPSANLVEAAQLMQKYNIRQIVVADGNGPQDLIPRGILTKHDLVNACPNGVDLFWQDPPDN
ncbi:MAG: CBS domain-containing protein, partial [Planctomycetota bacterium]